MESRFLKQGEVFEKQDLDWNKYQESQTQCGKAEGDQGR